MLDHIDLLTSAAGTAPDDADDIFGEAIAVERRLALAREQTWLNWYGDLIQGGHQGVVVGDR